MPTDTIIAVTCSIPAPPGRVFDAWLDEAHIGEWLFATPDGRMETVKLDPKVGRHFLIAERRDGELMEHSGSFVALDRPGRLVFDFSNDGGTTSARVIVDITTEGQGSLVRISRREAL